MIKDERAIQHPEAVAKLLIRGNIPLSMLRVVEEDLESYFLKIVGRNGEKDHEVVLDSISGGKL
ncbi:hypothetical protein D3C74_489440 [compost metagenome]